MEHSYYFILFLIVLALAFDFTNGFHDAGNAIATIVATGLLTPLQAVIWAAFFNMMAIFIFQLAVAKTIGVGLVYPDIVTPYVIFATLTSAILWNLITWYFGMPSSSSHALLGGLAGAAIAKGGWSTLILTGYGKVLIAIIITPICGIIIGCLFTLFLTEITRRVSEHKKHRLFKYLQLGSSALLSVTHGGNDAQKTMGIIAILLYSSSMADGVFTIPLWVVITCYLVIALGTLAGGWRIVHTMGYKITHLNNMKGCCAETSAAMIIFTSTELGIPVSTTHIVTGSIAGVGATYNVRGTQWKTISNMFLTWIITIPATAILADIISHFLP